jgi:hypothetical protein
MQVFETLYTPFATTQFNLYYMSIDVFSRECSISSNSKGLYSLNQVVLNFYDEESISHIVMICRIYNIDNMSA